MKTYKAKSLVSGNKLGLHTSQEFIAVPDKYDKEPVKAVYRDAEQVIDNWDRNGGTKTFNDKFGAGYYTLYYFEWNPDQKTLF